MEHQASSLDTLQEAIDYRFRDPALLRRALVHRSYVHENPDVEEDNETLEFLGDAVLGLAVSHILWRRFPGCREGELSRIRSSIVNERELARLALESGLGEHLLLGRGEDMSGGRRKPSLLADSFEALLAAIYLDGGLSAVLSVVTGLFGTRLDPSGCKPVQDLDKDFKTRLQELTQARFRCTPTYCLEAEEGPDHEKVFHISVHLEHRLVARGIGKSKKQAQQSAAELALQALLDELSRDGEG